MKKDKKLAFLLMSADILHPGHLNIIHEALKLDATIMVGLYSDEAVASYKRVPFMNFEQRKTVLENIKGVDIVIEQKTRDLHDTLLKYKPDYFVHGTDWRDGALAKEREKVLNIISQWGGVLVEPEYTKGICSSNAHNALKQRGTTSDDRQKKLFKAINVKKHLRATAVYDCITASLVSDAVVKQVGKPIAEFDALWIDSEQIAMTKGKNSSKLLDFSECYILMNEIADISVKPFIFNYGKIISSEVFNDIVHNLEKLGTSIIVIEENPDDTMEEFEDKIKQANLTLYDNTLQFAVKLSANKVTKDLIETYMKIDVDSFVLEGTLEEIKLASKQITALSPKAVLMAIVSDIKDKKELELYDYGVNILVYKDDAVKTIKNTVNKKMLDILEI